MPTSLCCSTGSAEEHYIMVPIGAASPSQKGTGGDLRLLKVSELVKGRASCHKTLQQIYTNGSLTQSKLALCAASQLPGEGPTDVEDAPAPAG